MSPAGPLELRRSHSNNKQCNFSFFLPAPVSGFHHGTRAAIQKVRNATGYPRERKRKKTKPWARTNRAAARSLLPFPRHTCARHCLLGPSEAEAAAHRLETWPATPARVHDAWGLPRRPTELITHPPTPSPSRFDSADRPTLSSPRTPRLRLRLRRRRFRCRRPREAVAAGADAGGQGRTPSPRTTRTPPRYSTRHSTC
jgi:hypothetical protein